MRRISVFSILTVVVIVFAAPAFAGAGVHLGMTVNPDDFLVGLHFKSSPMAEDLSLVPSVEAGFGDVTMIGGNLDLHYDLNAKSDLSPYLGGGLTLNWFDYEGGSDTQFGGSFLGGISLNSKFFFEAKVGIGDVPDWKLYVGTHMR